VGFLGLLVVVDDVLEGGQHGGVGIGSGSFANCRPQDLPTKAEEVTGGSLFLAKSEYSPWEKLWISVPLTSARIYLNTLEPVRRLSAISTHVPCSTRLKRIF
jgi:hypothetical protein